MIGSLIILALFAGIVFLALGLAAWVADREPAPERPDRRLSAREMELVGDDWRDHIADFFTTRADRREIIRDLTGATWTRY
jgi:hypothetical protein